MTDVFTKEKRSEIMRAVKSKLTKSTELKLAKIFREQGIKGWRRYYKLIGRPDFVFPKNHVVVFADGCFWHGHGCRNIKPKEHAQYWQNKIQKNIERDKRITEDLIRRGWFVIRIWECEINKNTYQEKLNIIRKHL
ncbi:MAG TPA: very short patch repair endonuclease [Candidatus Methanoperedens sp.]